MAQEFSIEAGDLQETSGRIQCFVNESEMAYLNWTIREENEYSVEIVDLLIHDSCDRQKGIGSLLIQKLIEVMLKKGLFEIWGHTQFDDYPVHYFYRKHGFIFDTKVKNGGISFRLELQHKK